MARQPTTRQLLASHLHHVFHVGERLPARATLAQLQAWHAAAHKRYLPHNHEPAGLQNGKHGRVVDIYLAPPKNPGSNNRQERNWTLGISKHQTHIVFHIPLAGTHANDADGALKIANQYLGYDPGWEPHGWGYRVKEDS